MLVERQHSELIVSCTVAAAITAFAQVLIGLNVITWSRFLNSFQFVEAF